MLVCTMGVFASTQKVLTEMSNYDKQSWTNTNKNKKLDFLMKKLIADLCNSFIEREAQCKHQVRNTVHNIQCIFLSIKSVTSQISSPVNAPDAVNHSQQQKRRVATPAKSIKKKKTHKLLDCNCHCNVIVIVDEFCHLMLWIAKQKNSFFAHFLHFMWGMWCFHILFSLSPQALQEMVGPKRLEILQFSVGSKKYAKMASR